LDLNSLDWATVAVCATMIGISKTGIPGFGILVVPLMALVLPTKQSIALPEG